MLEKFGIYSSDKKAELRRLSDLAREENTLNDRNNFFIKYVGQLKVKNDLSTEYPAEIILNKFKTKDENIAYLDKVGVSDKFPMVLDSLISTSRILSFGDNAERANSHINKISLEIERAVNELLTNVNELSTMPRIYLEKTKLYLENHSSKEEVLKTTKLKMNVLLGAINKELEGRPEEVSIDEYSFDKDNQHKNLIFKDLPEIIGEYEVENSEGTHWKLDTFYNSALTFYSKDDRMLNDVSNDMLLSNDNYFETCTDNEEKKLILNIYLSGIMNLQDAIKNKKMELFKTEKFKTIGVFPKFAAQVVKYFPASEISYRGKVAKGDKIAKLLEIASKAGETVDIISYTKDLLENSRIEAEKDTIIDSIGKMSR
jgi:hypothetical protein